MDGYGMWKFLAQVPSDCGLSTASCPSNIKIMQ